MANLINKIEEVPKDKGVIVFDLDGTLTESKVQLDPEMGALLAQLIKQKIVAVIGGGSFERFKTQLIAGLPAGTEFERLLLLPLNGASLYQFAKDGWHEVYSELLHEEEKQNIHAALDKALKETGFVGLEYLYGEQIEDRGGQITFSALGQDAPLEEKTKWSQEHEAERARLALKLQEYLPEMEVKVAGLTSIDITRKGIDKKFGIGRLASRLNILPTEMVFVGDAFGPGGNDEPTLDSGAVCFKVNSPKDTKRLASYLLS